MFRLCVIKLSVLCPLYMLVCTSVYVHIILCIVYVFVCWEGESVFSTVRLPDT